MKKHQSSGTTDLTLKHAQGAQSPQSLMYIVRTDVGNNFVLDCKSLFGRPDCLKLKTLLHTGEIRKKPSVCEKKRPKSSQTLQQKCSSAATTKK